MQPDEQDTLFVGEVSQKPPSVMINQSLSTAGVQPQRQDVSMIQPIQGTTVYIKAPKFKHQTRVASTVLSAIGLLLAFVTTSVGIFGDDSSIVALLGEGVCCLSFNAAFVCEIIFYSKMMEHNRAYNESQGSAIANIVLLSILTCVGFFLLIGIFLV